MVENYNLEILFVVWAFLFQCILILYFALRKWKVSTAMQYGWMVYAMSIPAVLVSVFLLASGMEVSFWLGGFLYLAWAVFGYIIEYVKKIQWRSPVRWPILLPYVTLYLGTIMFYWWPLGLINRSLWYVYGILFAISTILNITSHKVDQGKGKNISIE